MRNYKYMSKWKILGYTLCLLLISFPLMISTNFVLKAFVFFLALCFHDFGVTLIQWIESHNSIVLLISYLIPFIFGVWLVFLQKQDTNTTKTDAYRSNSSNKKTNRTSSVTGNYNRSSFSFIDGRGNYRRWGDDFIDADGNWCSWGSSYKDHEGNVCRWGSSFIDGKGSHRRWGDDFYDGAGNWVRFVE